MVHLNQNFLIEYRNSQHLVKKSPKKKDWLTLLFKNYLLIGDSKYKTKNYYLLFIDYLKDNTVILKFSSIMINLTKFINYLRFYFKRRKYRQNLIWMFRHIQQQKGSDNQFKFKTKGRNYSMTLVDLDLPIAQCIFQCFGGLLNFPQASVYASNKKGKFLVQKLGKLGIINFVFQSLNSYPLRGTTFLTPWNFNLSYPLRFLENLSFFFLNRTRFLNFFFYIEEKKKRKLLIKNTVDKFAFKSHLLSFFNYRKINNKSLKSKKKVGIDLKFDKNFKSIKIKKNSNLPKIFFI